MFVAGDPDLRRQLLDQLATVDGRAVTLAVMGGLALIDAALILAADRRFRRARLVAR